MDELESERGRLLKRVTGGGIVVETGVREEQGTYGRKQLLQLGVVWCRKEVKNSERMKMGQVVVEQEGATPLYW